MASFDQTSVSAAQQAQQYAAQDVSPHIRLIAGPGSGKSRTIMMRLLDLVNQGVAPNSIYVISFTRASAFDLRSRVINTFNSGNNALAGQQIAGNVTTMHSLALKLLANADLLASMYPTPPVVLDQWQQENIFDAEFSVTAKVTAKRAREVRAAFDAHWQTLAALNISGGTTPPTQLEQNAFTSYYPTAKSLYSCLLPGEVVQSCVVEISQGSITASHLPGISHLIVDEYQDLNYCDQRFVDHIAGFGANVFIAGDDDQSVYSFRHAAPNGIINYCNNYQNAASYNLQHCFRCTTSILSAAQQLILHNQGRIPKIHLSMYRNSSPAVSGTFSIWRCKTGTEEAKWIAESCRDLIAANVPPNEILILLRSNSTQGPVLYEALEAAGVEYEPARGDSLLEEPMPRLVHSLLEIVKNPTQKYIPYRVILGLLHGVGKATCTGIANRTVTNLLNFRDLFYFPLPPGAFTSSQASAIKRVAAIVNILQGWSDSDILFSRTVSIAQIGALVYNLHSQPGIEALLYWNSLVKTLPTGMTLDELYSYLDSDKETGRFQILDSVARRLAANSVPQQSVATSRVRALTMHGSKGLEGQVVFIPGAEEKIVPSGRAIATPGQVNEERRLMYTAITRAKACCIVSMAGTRIGNQAFLLSGSPVVNQVRSRFIPEIGTPVMNRTSGLTNSEITKITNDIANL